ncbi:MAG: HAMP domain-containing histidine kinase [Myxacorys californica WJT36-NPBG1]|jgi:signal transduction histidine kinase|nr:HAMP domain-containing histidine kinase [Myxacorys californica WJT36-NPBG1]
MKSTTQQLNRWVNQYLMLFLTGAVILSLGLIAFGSWNARQISQGFKEMITTEFKVQQLRGEIIHLDEVLTMSARMAAATGDLKWEQRYRTFEPQLDTAIKQATQLAPEIYAKYANQTDAANVKLVEMENQAFNWVRQLKPAQALAMLFSPSYETQKQIYADGMTQTSSALQRRVRTNFESYGLALSQLSLFSTVSFFTLTAAWITILGLVNRYLKQRREAETKLRVAKTELEQINQNLEISEVTLRQKAGALEQALEALQQTQLQMIQSEKMSSLGQLVAGVAHEINNPINFIYGNLAHLRNYVQDLHDFVHLHQKYYPHPAPEIQAKATEIDLEFLQLDLAKILDSMSVGTERIRQIVLTLRNFSRMDEAEFKSVDIHEGIDSTLMILQQQLNAQPGCPAIQVMKEYDDLPLVECYPGQLNQVFMNILANAIDALEAADPKQTSKKTRENLSEIIIRTSVLDAEWVQITITDNGPGMPESVKQRIFDPFFSTKPVGKGTGLGMSISYQIVKEQHRGKLDCFSSPGEGTQFVIQIPIHQSVYEIV